MATHMYPQNVLPKLEQSSAYKDAMARFKVMEEHGAAAV